MKFIDIMIISIVAFWAVLAIRYIIRARKKGHIACIGCCHSCQQCQACQKRGK